jgi:hypothetical protein
MNAKRNQLVNVMAANARTIGEDMNANVLTIVST